MDEGADFGTNSVQVHGYTPFSDSLQLLQKLW